MKPRVLFLAGHFALMPTAMAAGDAIVFLGSNEDEFRKNLSPACMERAMQEVAPKRTVVAARKFRDALFPFFEPETAPRSVEDLTLLLSKPIIQERLESTGVRHVVAVGAARSGTSDGAGPFLCTLYGCFGAVVSTSSAEIHVALWDLRRPQGPAHVVGTSAGRNVVIAFMVPIPFMADTRNQACSDAAKRIADAIESDYGR